MDDIELRDVQLEVPTGYKANTRLDKYIVQSIENISRSKVQEAIDADLVKVNGQNAKSSQKMRPGDVIDIRWPRVKRPDLKAEKIPLDIVYEDDDLIIVNKPPDMVVHPAFGNWTGTMVNGLLWYTDQLSDSDDNDNTMRPGIVHRLDKDTSGLIVVAKNDEAHRVLSRSFAERKVEKRYWAIVWGTPEKEGTIEVPLGRSPRDRKKVTVLSDDKGKHAVSHYEVLEYFDHLALVEINLETGRTHQIRVHFKHIGHPVLGDATYGGNSVRYGPNTGSRKNMFKNIFARLGRQCLHAKKLGFKHPKTGAWMDFDSTLPEDFQEVLDKLRNACKPEL